MKKMIKLPTSEQVYELEGQVELKELKTLEDFMNMLKLEQVIIYLLVDWSGPERFSRYVVYKALYELHAMNIPVYKIDCSDQNKDYVVWWLRGQKDDGENLHYGGNGETLLIKNGKLEAFIKLPWSLGTEKVKEIFESWQ